MTDKICHRRAVGWRALIATLVLVGMTTASTVEASDKIYFSANTNITNLLVQKINAETVRIDMAIWHLTEHSISIALLNRFKAGVPVRLIGDRAELFELNAVSRGEFYWLANEGVPIRVRFDPTWYPEISHWKATIFAGQNLVAFGSANYTPFELAPVSATNYKDETVLFSDDPAIVNAIKTKFDRMWNDTTPEPESRVPGPPYLKDWNAACATDHTGACDDYHARYPNPKPMIIRTERLEPDNPLPPELVWGQGSSFNNRLVQEINAETQLVQLVLFRMTVSNITDALLNKWNSGVPVQVLLEPQEYHNRAWPEFWLTHANIDKLWAAGVPIKWRVHQGLTHMKTLVTSNYAVNASANFAAAWQRDINYFIPRASKPLVHQAMRDRVNAMWNDPAAFATFQPQPPDAATLSAPVSGSTGLSTRPTLVWNRAPFATSYDIYLGTVSGSLSLVGNVPAQLVNEPPTTYSWTAPSALSSGTTYFWKVVSRTFATAKNPAIVATSATRSFTTGGSAPVSGPLPTPWVSGDVGPVGLSGSAAYATGTFTVAGAGADIWGASDSFHYVSQGVNGDAQITARVTAIQNTHPYAKAGLMLRESTQPGAAHVILNLQPNGRVEFMKRSASGGETTWLAGVNHATPAWLKLVRSGSTITGLASANGSTWTTVGTTTLSIAAAARVGLAVTSHDQGVRNTTLFDSVAVSSALPVLPPPPPPPPPAPLPTAPNIVVHASGIPGSALHGNWVRATDLTSPGGVKLATADYGLAQLDYPLASPAHYFDVSVPVVGGVQYTVWLRLKAAANSKYNDAVWVQFSGARVNGAPAYGINTTSGLLVNLATDGTGGSLANWGWQNRSYWLSQAATVSFSATGTQTIRVQIREDGVQLDQIVLSPNTYLTKSPGTVANDVTIVPKP